MIRHWHGAGIVADAELRFFRRGLQVMGMPAAYTEWTVDLLDALPESSERFELVDGELYVTPSPGIPHQGVVLLLASRLLAYTSGAGTARTIISPSDVRRGDFRKNRVQPDIYVVALRDGRLPDYPFHLRELMLAIEVTSPGKPFLDYEVKRRLYLSEGVGEYWVVDGAERSASRWRGILDPGEVVTDRIEWHLKGADSPFVVDLPAFFDGAIGLAR